MLGAIEISGARYTRVHVPVQLVRRHKWVVVSHKKNIPGVRRQQLKSVANRSLSGVAEPVLKKRSTTLRESENSGLLRHRAQRS